MMAKQQGKLSEFWMNSKRIFAIAKKPTRKEYNMVVKICLLGLGIVGGLSYVIQLIATAIQGTGSS